MFKPMTAGLMCLGLVTLGVTLSRGDAPDVVEDQTIEIESREPEVSAELRDVIVNAEGEVATQVREIERFKAGINADVAEITITGHPGEIPAVPPVAGVARVEFKASAGLTDPVAREGLEKIVAQLKADEARLRDAGKMEEAESKLRSRIMLDAVLAGKGPGKTLQLIGGRGPNHIRYVAPPVAARMHAEMQHMHAQQAELHAKRGQMLAEKSDADVSKIDNEIRELHQKIAESGKQVELMFGQRAIGVVHGHPGALALAEGNFDVMLAHGVPGGPPGGPEAAALEQKAEALARAAEQLGAAGLHDQSRELAAQSQKLRAEAAQRRTHVQYGFVRSVGGHPAELHRALTELREQVQELRREVGHLRELLERKP